jgi:hypothetical protein
MKDPNMLMSRALPRGGGGGKAAARPKPQELKFKKQIFVDFMIPKVIRVSPSTEISHSNRLMISTLEFCKIN